MVRLGTQNGRKLERKHLTTAILCGLLVGSHAEPVRILCLGDSITQGGKNDRAEYTYRWPLFCMLVDAEVDFDFIGSLDTGLNKDAKWPETYKGKPFDLDHEGIYGIKTRDALNRLPEASKQWDGIPDIALIHLGSNDKGEDNPVDDVKEPLRKIIEFLREQNPDIVILLGHLLSNDDPNAFRVMAVVSELRKEMDTEKSPVRVVQHYRNWHENPGLPNTDTFDWGGATLCPSQPPHNTHRTIEMARADLFCSFGRNYLIAAVSSVGCRSATFLPSAAMRIRCRFLPAVP